MRYFSSTLTEWNNLGRESYSNSASPYDCSGDWVRERFDIVCGRIYETRVKESKREKEDNYQPAERHVVGNLAMLDTKTRKGKPINVLKLVAYLYRVTEVRQLVFLNSWGIVVRDPKRPNIPAKVILASLYGIIKEALTTPDLKDKETILIALDEAPRDSIAGKIWAVFETVTLLPVIDYIKDDIDEIPLEDLEFWRAIYRKRKDLTLGRQFKVC